MKAMRIAVSVALGMMAAGVCAVARQPAATATGGTVVVIAELFTSEGCSSCPAADELLTQLVQSQPLPGIHVIGLSEHVDYWDRLGWRDPFSSPLFTERQTSYGSRVFRDGDIYTPQIVIDGQLQAPGNDGRAIESALREAAQLPKAAVSVKARLSGSAVVVDVDARAPDGLELHGPAGIMVAVVEDGLATAVTRGENKGRTLGHSAVVRSLRDIGAISNNARAAAKSATLNLDKAWALPRLRIVAFVQERRGRRILGGASTTIGS
jgi:hypothetical protein